MKTSRFLPSFMLIALAIRGLAAAEVPPPEALQPPDLIPLARFEKLPAHPRLLANAERFAALRTQIVADENSARLFALLRASGESVLAAPPIVYPEVKPGENLLKILREAEHRTLTLAMLYRLTGERRYLEGTLAVLHGLADLTWLHGHFLDPATACFTLSLGYDWLYDELTPDERELFAAKIQREALAYTRENVTGCSFLWANFNWNQICNSCLALGALATAEHDLELAHYIVNRSLALIPRAAAGYAPDGVYPEGPGYWAYGTTYHVLQIEALRSAFGESFGLEKFPGFLASASVLDQLTGPSGEWFNYFDNHPTRKYGALVFWFARETNRADLTAAEWTRVLAAPAGENATSGQRDLALVLLWMRPSGAGSAAAPALPLHWRGEGHQPVAVLRSKWNDPAATWFAIKGGTPDYSHGHMDAGSFVFEAGGVRWAVEPEIEDYLVARNRLGLTHGEFFTYAQDSARWRYFRLGPEGHNLLRFDGARQMVSGHGELSPIIEGKNGAASVTAELSPVYAGQADNVRRTAELRADGSVVLTDTWIAPVDHAVSATWQWLTPAVATLETGGVRLEQGERRLHLRVAGGAEVKIELQDVATVLDPKIDGLLPGHTRIVLRTSSPAGQAGRFEVTAELEPAR